MAGPASTAAGRQGPLPFRVVGIMEERGWSLADLYRELGHADCPRELREVFWFSFDGQAKEVLAPTLDPVGFRRRSPPLCLLLG